jgi:O-antigen/teichoic acid export membrane protein
MESKKEKDSDLDNNLKLFIKTSFFVFIGIIICKILTYVYRIIVARNFGLEVYGFFSISLMIFTLASIIALFGLGDGILRYFSSYRGTNDKANMKRLYKFVLKFLIISSIIITIAVFFLSNFIAVSIFHNEKLAGMIKLFGLALPFYMLYLVFLNILKSFEKISLFSLISNIIEPSSKILVMVILIFLGLNYTLSISISFVITSLLLLVISYFFYKLYISDFFIHAKEVENKGLISDFLKYSFPLMFSSIVIFIFGWTEIFLLGYLKSVNEVAIYNVALPIALLLTITPTLFTYLFFPIINKEYARKNLDLIKELSKQIGKWIFIINAPFLILFLIFPGAIINILFGSAYLGGKIAIIFLSIGFFIMSQNEIPYNLLNMEKRSRLILLNILLTIVLSIILNLYLIPMPMIGFIDNSTGIAGAAISTMFANIFYCALTFFQAYFYLKIIPLRKKMFNIIISSIIAGFLLAKIKNLVTINLFNLFWLVGAFILIYLALLFLTRSLDKNDLKIFNTIKYKLLGMLSNSDKSILKGNSIKQ